MVGRLVHRGVRPSSATADMSAAPGRSILAVAMATSVAVLLWRSSTFAGVGHQAAPLGRRTALWASPDGFASGPAAPRGRSRAEVAAEAAAAAAVAAMEEATRREASRMLLEAAAATCRGQCGTEEERRETLRLIEELEFANPTPEPATAMDLLEGEWRLVYASEDVTRSSPFFWAWRRLLEGVPDPNPVTRLMFGTEDLSESIFAVTDNLPAKSIGEASQSIGAGRLVNRVAVAVFGLGRTMITTTCRYTEPRLDPSSMSGGLELALTVETTQAVGGSPLAEQVVFPSESFLGASADVVMRVTYLDDTLRVVRNAADDRCFVYARASSGGGGGRGVDE
mmetsp:Transcript_92321/g.296895  ORF Transcript_92321/g.296895 Transcript_92321/m.296895 type:complete len:339 (-) Transcript_92321:138-1154(-)|eukprot:CAMPEP_0203936116 /NCGR_PEP_ID=MMETSP0359-20131031/73741_1 /ASSEMBLY_ACC=CAM_ASM_000338 /TAXON_ID=268821 /ORGANISM="Scrippsiella Hangoei, Strain SHTV-5" /LENGTH=338 /DNA_ID=CAMNT_0050866051 /DNA_START=16 /DNA_END=1032 /DNA_ORIENTATION=-